MRISKINQYLIKAFLKRFTYVVMSISILILIINFFDVSNKANEVESMPFHQILLMSALQVPTFLADISIFVILVSTMITLFSLSSKSEITVMRSSGLSIWKILSPIIITNFIIGLIFIFAFLPLTISSNTKYTKMERELIENERLDSFAPRNGIWLKHPNMQNQNEEIKIRAHKIYKNNLKFEKVAVWFFDENNNFYKRIDAKEMYLVKNKWVLKSAILNDKKNINQEIEMLEIATDLEADFILQKILNNFQEVKLFSVIELPKLISNLESAGFSSRKFKVYFHSLLNYPLLFVCMAIVAAYFSINNGRSRSNSLYVVLGIIFGLFAYVGLNIINAFGSSGLLPAFMSTWLVTLLFLAGAIILIFRKESL